MQGHTGRQNSQGPHHLPAQAGDNLQSYRRTNTTEVSSEQSMTAAGSMTLHIGQELVQQLVASFAYCNAVLIILEPKRVKSVPGARWSARKTG